jgi:uncharacterized membrane protein YfcA
MSILLLDIGVGQEMWVPFDLVPPDPIVFWAIALASIFVVSISKSGFGGGIAAFGTPLMLLILPPKLALGVLLPLYFLTDIWVSWVWRNHIDQRILGWMFLFGFFGQVTGWLLFDYFSDQLLKAVIASMALLTAINYWRKELSTAQKNPVTSGADNLVQRALIWCGLSGISSFVSLSGSIPAQIFLLRIGLVRQSFVGTMSLYFLLMNLAKMPFYAQLGLFTADSITMSAMLIGAIPVGIYVGRKLNQILSDQLFYRISHALLLLMGTKLFVDALG